MACLTVLDGSLKGQRFALEQPLTRIGRREGNDWVVPDNSISGTHCEIAKSDAGFVIRDLGSTNGTKVNNVAIKEKALSRNDIILIGEVPMMIEGDDVPQSTKTAPISVPRTTIIIQPKRTLETPKEFGKKTNSNKIWVSVIVVLVLVIAYLLVQLFAGGGA
ncbi:MAG TPA: FHA domain-containing protein [Kiritimatiellia bacterium]|nr:FHA domain-containing protein [Kiritimatiellia bacterium]